MGHDLRYKHFEARSRSELDLAFASSDPNAIAEALDSAAYHELDWRWVQDRCLTFLTHSEVRVRWAAAQCLGLLAVFHKQLDLARVLPAMYQSMQDEAIKSEVEFSLNDINRLVRKQ